jgi:N-acetylglucosamine kinase-like BadF-type ATPase
VTLETVLAVDGGNSKADVALVGSDGRLIGAVRGPTISHQATDLATATSRLAALIAAARNGTSHVAEPRLAVHCVAGADYPDDVALLGRAFSGVEPGAEVVVLNDTFAALRAGSSRPWGIALICGQGINGAAVGRNGRTARFAGVGDIAGDWGGGTSVGMEGLAAAVRGRDGRGPRTALERTIPAAVGLRRPDAVTRAYYTRRLDLDRIGELAPTVFETAMAGDAVARSIVDRLADELATMAAALARRTALIRLDPDVVLAGGVFRTIDGAFHERVAHQVRAAIPAARVVRLSEPPVAGAALIGLDRLAGGTADPAAERRLRSELASWSATPQVVTPS